MRLRVHILVFDQVEALDFAGPYEVFTTASRVHHRLHPGLLPPFEVACVARERAAVTARAGLRILPDQTLADAPPADLLIVPGGVVDAAMACPATRGWVARQAQTARITASVCTGAFLLAAAGVLTHQTVTTHWEDVADLRRQFPLLKVIEGPRWVDQGPLVTSAGISAGLDMSLHLVARLASHDLALRTARQMDYDWNADAWTGCAAAASS